jgi:two-component system response regulator DesR
MIVQIVEDQSLMRSAITDCLQGEPWIETIVSATNGQEALAVYSSTLPHLLILDVELPKMSGLQVAEKLIKEASPPRILVISGFLNEATLGGVSKLPNIHGFLFKEDGFFVKLRTVAKRILNGETYFCEGFKKRVAELLTTGLRIERVLSFKERRILGLLGAGWTDERIALKLLITQTTVRWHTQQMRQKLGVNSTRELVHLAYKSGFTGANWDEMDLVDNFDIP